MVEEGAMGELKACLYCKSANVLIRGVAGDHYIRCMNCGAQGPVESTAVFARDSWNRRDDALAREVAEALDFLTKHSEDGDAFAKAFAALAHAREAGLL